MLLRDTAAGIPIFQVLQGAYKCTERRRIHIVYGLAIHHVLAGPKSTQFVSSPETLKTSYSAAFSTTAVVCP